MAVQNLLLVVTLCVTLSHAGISQSGSPLLDLNYALENLDNQLKRVGHDPGQSEQSSSQSTGYGNQGHDSSSGYVGSDQPVKTSLYSNNAGDEALAYEGQPGSQYNPDSSFNSRIVPGVASQSDYSAGPSDVKDPQRTDLSGFGNSIEDTNNQYPVVFPPTLSVQHSDGSPDYFAKRVPNYYSNLNDPLSADHRQYNGHDNGHGNNYDNGHGNSYDNGHGNGYDNGLGNGNDFISKGLREADYSKGDVGNFPQLSSKDRYSLLSPSFPTGVSSAFPDSAFPDRKVDPGRLLGGSFPDSPFPSAGGYLPSKSSTGGDYGGLRRGNSDGASGYGQQGSGQVIPVYHPQSVNSGHGSTAGYGVVDGGDRSDDVVIPGRYSGVVPSQHHFPSDVYKYRKEMQCWPQFFFEYEHDFIGAVWQDVKGQVHVQQGRAVFGGDGFLAIPFFACNDLLPRYSMMFVIGPSYKSSGPQAVIGNSVYPGKSSLLVVLSGNNLILVVRQRAANLTPEQLLTQCKNRRKRSVGDLHEGFPSHIDNGYQQVQPVVHGSDDPRYGSTYGDIVVLELAIFGEVTVTIAQEKDNIYFSAGDQHVSKPGRLPTLTNEALYVGAGADPRGGEALAHYTGTFDSFLFEKCP